MPKRKEKSQEVHLRYSLLSENFQEAVGKRLVKKLERAITRWTSDKNDRTASELVDAYVESMASYWKRSDMHELEEHKPLNGFRLTVDLVYKRGRKPNTIRLEDNPRLKQQLKSLFSSS
jgi:hypothetical protein